MKRRWIYAVQWEWACSCKIQNHLKSMLKSMIDLIPKVLTYLEHNRQKESFLKFMNLLATETGPMNNKCYLLFLDIVEWFSCNSTTHMR